MNTETPKKKMYLILREDLAYKYIQGGHALAQFALEYPESFQEWNNQYLICLSVFNGIALQRIFDTMAFNEFGYLLDGIIPPKVSLFVEPDLKSDLPTAICLYDPNKLYKDIVKDLNLATK